jgi:hypothetical protein
MLLFSLASCNPQPDPESLIQSWNDALNEGDVDAALEYLADDAVVTIVPPPPDMSGVFSGKDQIRGWYEGNVAQGGFNEFVEIKVDGDKVSWVSKFGMEEWQKIGVDSLKTLGEGIFVDGKFQSYTVTIPPESLAELPPPPEQKAENEPVEINVLEIADMVGIWSGRAMGDAGYHKFNQDGTFTVAWNFGDLDTSPAATAKYWFEGNVFHVEDGCGHGMYEVTIQKKEGGSTKLRFTLLEDPCETRTKDWKSGMRLVEQ